MHLLESKIRQANAQGRPALIPFLTSGFPDRAAFWPAIMELDEAGVDIIEIGIPFSDPVADGPTVENASRLALSEGVTLRETIQELQTRRKMINAGIVFMGYYNPFLQYGLENFAKDAAESGVNGVIVPDLPYDEDHPFRSVLKKYDLALIPLVGPNTVAERMQLYAQASCGYAYVVSVLGVTGARKDLAPQVASTMRRARENFALPLALGFGLREPAQLEDLPADARPDAVVFGSALLKHLSDGLSARDFIARWI